MVSAPYIFSPKKGDTLQSQILQKCSAPWQLKNDEEVAKASGVWFAGEVDGYHVFLVQAPRALASLKWLQVSIKME